MKTNWRDIFIFPLIGTIAFSSFYLIKKLDNFSSVSDIFLFLILFGLLTAVFIRTATAIWPLRSGKYMLDQAYTSYWKLYALTYMFGKSALIINQIDLFKPLVASLFGAKIGKGVAIAGHINEPALVTIGDYSILGHYSVVTPHAIISGKIVLAKINIGKEVTIGVNSTIMSGVEIGDGALVMPNSFVPMNTIIKKGEIWCGVPAKKIGVREVQFMYQNIGI